MSKVNKSLMQHLKEDNRHLSIRYKAYLHSVKMQADPRKNTPRNCFRTVFSSAGCA